MHFAQPPVSKPRSPSNGLRSNCEKAKDFGPSPFSILGKSAGYEPALQKAHRRAGSWPTNRFELFYFSVKSAVVPRELMCDA
jgi:hypothetical protein